MIRQCAWCLLLMGEVQPLKDTSITHGMCEKCEKAQIEEIRKMHEKQQLKRAV